jgi:hypothetical protein
MLVALLTSQPFSGWLKAPASKNISLKVVTWLTSQALRSSLNVLAQSASLIRPLMSVTPLTHQSEMWPSVRVAFVELLHQSLTASLMLGHIAELLLYKEGGEGGGGEGGGEGDAGGGEGGGVEGCTSPRPLRGIASAT